RRADGRTAAGALQASPRLDGRRPDHDGEDPTRPAVLAQCARDLAADVLEVAEELPDGRLQRRRVERQAARQQGAPGRLPGRLRGRVPALERHDLDKDGRNYL